MATKASLCIANHSSIGMGVSLEIRQYALGARLKEDCRGLVPRDGPNPSRSCGYGCRGAVLLG